MVKMLAGSYHVDVNIKSHGGYTPLHLACQFGHQVGALNKPSSYKAEHIDVPKCPFSSQEVFDLLVKAYGADPRLRDNHGKTPRQYMVAASVEQTVGLSLSNDTFRQLKDRRRNRRQASENKNPGILRFGSLSVRVKKTTEAFNNYFGSERKHSWGSNSQEGGAGGPGGRMADQMDARKHSWGPSSSSSADGLVISSPIPIAGSGPNVVGNVIDLVSTYYRTKIRDFLPL